MFIYEDMHFKIPVDVAVVGVFDVVVVFGVVVVVVVSNSVCTVNTAGPNLGKIDGIPA